MSLHRLRQSLKLGVEYTPSSTELFVDWLFYSIHLRIAFAETELRPSKMQNPTLRAAFRGALAYVFAARRAWGLSRSSSWPRARPAAASAVAIPLPMPLDAPLTTATLPVSLLIVLSLPWCRCAAGDARRQFLPGTWTIMLTVVSDLNTRTSNGNAMFIEFQKTALDRS